jgi:hypothetical protein
MLLLDIDQKYLIMFQFKTTPLMIVKGGWVVVFHLLTFPVRTGSNTGL